MSVYAHESKLWRFLLTDLASLNIVLLDHLARSRELKYVFGGPSEARMNVPSGDALIRIPFPDPTSPPYLAEGVRLLYGFRRDDNGGSPWVCRFGGRCEQTEDVGATEDGTTSLVAYDSWRYMQSRLCKGWQIEGQEQNVGAEGLVYKASRGDGPLWDPLTPWSPVTIIQDQVRRIAGVTDTTASGWAVFDDTLWAEFGLVEGDMDATDTMLFDYTVTQGMSLGAMLTELMSFGICDITIDPLYDPAISPGMTGTINIEPKAGQFRPAAVFAWDTIGRNLSAVSKLVDGTKRVNRLRFYGGKAGAPVPTGEDTNSQALYGLYEEEQFFPNVVQPWAYSMLANSAAQQVGFRSRGQITVTVGPTPDRAPRPFIDWEMADWAPVYWSDQLREPSWAPGSNLVQRMVGFTLGLSDDALETVTELLVVASTEDQPSGQQGGPPVAAGIDAQQALPRAWGPGARGSGATGTTQPFRIGGV